MIIAVVALVILYAAYLYKVYNHYLQPGGLKVVLHSEEMQGSANKKVYISQIKSINDVEPYDRLEVCGKDKTGNDTCLRTNNAGRLRRVTRLSPSELVATHGGSPPLPMCDGGGGCTVKGAYAMHQNGYLVKLGLMVLGLSLTWSYVYGGAYGSTKELGILATILLLWYLMSGPGVNERGPSLSTGIQSYVALMESEDD